MEMALDQLPFVRGKWGQFSIPIPFGCVEVKSFLQTVQHYLQLTDWYQSEPVASFGGQQPPPSDNRSVPSVSRGYNSGWLLFGRTLPRFFNNFWINFLVLLTDHPRVTPPRNSLASGYLCVAPPRQVRNGGEGPLLRLVGAEMRRGERG